MKDNLIQLLGWLGLGLIIFSVVIAVCRLLYMVWHPLPILLGLGVLSLAAMAAIDD